MQEMFERDPEEVGPEHPEDFEFRQRLRETIHWYENKLGYGKCEAPSWRYCYEHKEVDGCQNCGLEKWSVLHHSEEYTREDIEDY